MERAVIERIIREGYDARRRGDVEGACRVFADDAQFVLAGAPATSPVAVRSASQNTLRQTLAALVAGFEFLEHEILSVVVEGDKAAVHSRVRLRAQGTGHEAVTETADFVTVRDGKIASFVQFCDTALAARLTDGQPVQGLPR
jgi:ketosteroid isomerase-like protein